MGSKLTTLLGWRHKKGDNLRPQSSEIVNRKRKGDFLSGFGNCVGISTWVGLPSPFKLQVFRKKSFRTSIFGEKKKNRLRNSRAVG